MTGTGGDLAEIGARGELGELAGPSRSTAPATCGSPTAATTASRPSRPTARCCSASASAASAPGSSSSRPASSVDCNGLVTVADADNNRVQRSSSRPARRARRCRRSRTRRTRSSTTSREPLPPEVSVRPTRTTGILAIRQFPLRISSDLPCEFAIPVTLAPRSGKRRAGRADDVLAAVLPAGRTVTYRPRLSTAGVRTLRRALGSRRGLVAEIRVVADQRRQLRRRRHRSGSM